MLCVNGIWNLFNQSINPSVNQSSHQSNKQSTNYLVIAVEYFVLARRFWSLERCLVVFFAEESKEITAKKVRGVGLGNIFAGGMPNKSSLRPTDANGDKDKVSVTA